ncbi:MAG: hypothetical protein GXP55_24235, partial [Deltaproteobacteria bacterium]|nr:hypothetical protein [Deltaproteobacteria bacterium]
RPPTRCPNVPPGASSAPTITPAFTIPEGVTAVRVRYTLQGPSAWVGLSSALIDMTRGAGRQWSETVGNFRSRGSGTRTASTTLTQLQSGPHTLRIDPRWAREACPPGTAPSLSVQVTTVHASRSVGGSMFCCASATFVLALPLIVAFSRRRAFERKRWQNSSLV